MTSLKAILNRVLYGPGDFPQPEVLNLLGIGIQNTDTETALAAIVDAPATTGTRIVNFANPHCLNLALENAAYKAALRNSDLVLPDGSGLRVAGRIRGEGLRENLNGTDLFPKICRRAADKGLSIFLLGARPGIAAAVAHRMVAEIPGLRVAGVRDGYFDAEQTGEVIDEINDSGADLLFVAMGVPMQELWLDEHKSQLGVRSALGVGGLFDFYSGRIARAPRWVREIGLEWIWRLAMEPRRMWRRYLVGNFKFVYRIWCEARSGRA